MSVEINMSRIDVIGLFHSQNNIDHLKSFSHVAV